jgi:four helix bundle protein
VTNKKHCPIKGLLIIKDKRAGAEQLKKRTQLFGLNIVKFIQALPNQEPVRIIEQQLARCGTSVGANFRAACRARSHADFNAKLKIVEEECDESIYWAELLRDLNINTQLIQPLMDEANQLLSITVASIKTARRNT